MYAIIIQSEYVRHFIELTDKRIYLLKRLLFRNYANTQGNYYFNISKANGSSVTRKTEEIETPISQFNKKELCDYIISNGSLASQKLLKLAVAYRFAADHYSGNGSGGSIDVKDIADEEEFRMIKDIVVAIVQDYNLLRKELKLDYNENEIKTGIPEL